MDQDAKNELTSILVAYRERVVEGRAREANVKAARAAFVEAFVRVKAEIIRPVLEEFVLHLNEAGHQATLTDQKESSDRNGQFSPASMALRVVPIRIGDTPLAPSGGTRIEVTFSANEPTMKVVVSSSNNANGAIGKRGDYELAGLDKRFVETHVLKTIHEAFAAGK